MLSTRRALYFARVIEPGRSARNVCLRCSLKQWQATRRDSSSASSTRWKARQSKDAYAREAKVKGLKSRAAFKLLEIDEKHKIFKRGDTVVDLGFAPGSWSQVAVSRTRPRGRVIGIDIIPAQPPRGVSTIQGNFLDPAVQARVQRYLHSVEHSWTRKVSETEQEEAAIDAEGNLPRRIAINEDAERSIFDVERAAGLSVVAEEDLNNEITKSVWEGTSLSVGNDEYLEGCVVDVVLSDMSEPWPQTTGMWVNSISNPYRRMMNTSGISFKDHAGSMDLCLAALSFCFDTLKTGGRLVLKYYQGQEEKALEKKLALLFQKVYREKPDASRDGSKEAYFVALKRRREPSREQIFAD